MKTFKPAATGTGSWNRPVHPATVVAVLLLTAFFSGSVVDGQQSSPRVRTLPYSLEPIANQLLPEDDVVLVEREFDSALFPDPSASDIIAYAGGRADLVAVIDVKEVVSFLAENGTWVRTRVSAATPSLMGSA
jgi:hypothetical protein